MDNNKNFKILNKYGYITYKFDKEFMFKYHIKDNHYFFGLYKNTFFIIDLAIINNCNYLTIDFGNYNIKKEQWFKNNTKIMYPNKNDILLWNKEFGI